MNSGSHKILIVDDDAAVRRMLQAILGGSYEVRQAASGGEALRQAADWSPELVLLDIVMPGMDGYETCRKLKQDPRRPAPQVIMVSAHSALEEQVRGYEAGADDYLVKPIDPVELRARVQLHFRLLNATTVVSTVQDELETRRAELRQMAIDRTREVIAIQDVAIFTLAKVAESRDNDTGQHLVRMREYAQLLATYLAAEPRFAEQIDSHFLDDLYRSSPLHDIGKVGIPDAILLKPGRLTPKEFEIMKQHTTIGAKILHEAIELSPSGGFLAIAASITESHHERWDGNGYPSGLRGEQIPLPARIVAVADVYDALTSKRPYKAAWTPERAYQQIVDGDGTQFDPAVVVAFKAQFPYFLDVQLRHDDMSSNPLGVMAFLQQQVDDLNAQAIADGCAASPS